MPVATFVSGLPEPCGSDPAQDESGPVTKSKGHPDGNEGGDNGQ